MRRLASRQRTLEVWRGLEQRFDEAGELLELATLDGVNHLLLAASGSEEENASSGNPEISRRVAEILIDWIERTLPAE